MTNESTALAIRQITPSVWQMVQSMGPVMHAARLFKTGSDAQAMAIMLKGYELGLSLTASFEFIDIVEGKPSLSPRGMLALIHQHDEVAEIKITEAKDSCTVYMKRKDGFSHSVTWTMEDAKKAGVVKPNSGWDKYPANMLRWRAIGFCADVVCPDLIGGLKRADEYGADITPEGNVIQGEWTTVQPTPEPTAPTLQELTDKYGPEKVMKAAEGVLPEPNRVDKWIELAQKLGSYTPDEN